MSETSNFSDQYKRRAKAPAIDPEEREKQLISLAVNNAERRLMSGTAPTAIVVHYLKLASAREELEKEKLRKEIALLETKKLVADSAMHIEELYTNAIKAMTTYGSSINNESSVEESE